MISFTNAKLLTLKVYNFILYLQLFVFCNWSVSNNSLWTSQTNYAKCMLKNSLSSDLSCHKCVYQVRHQTAFKTLTHVAYHTTLAFLAFEFTLHKTTENNRETYAFNFITKLAIIIIFYQFWHYKLEHLHILRQTNSSKIITCS